MIFSVYSWEEEGSIKMRWFVGSWWISTLPSNLDDRESPLDHLGPSKEASLNLVSGTCDSTSIIIEVPVPSWTKRPRTITDTLIRTKGSPFPYQILLSRKQWSQGVVGPNKQIPILNEITVHNPLSTICIDALLRREIDKFTLRFVDYYYFKRKLNLELKIEFNGLFRL